MTKVVPSCSIQLVLWATVSAALAYCRHYGFVDTVMSESMRSFVFRYVCPHNLSLCPRLSVRLDVCVCPICLSVPVCLSRSLCLSHLSLSPSVCPKVCVVQPVRLFSSVCLSRSPCRPICSSVLVCLSRSLCRPFCSSVLVCLSV